MAPKDLQLDADHELVIKETTSSDNEGIESIPRKDSDQQADDPPAILAATIALCFCMLTHSYLLISVFPYSGYLAVELLHVSSEQAGPYAGWIASSFMIGRACTAYQWGKIADTYGRTRALYASLALSCLWSVAFGLVPNYTSALIIRFLMGASNGLVGGVKTIVSELCARDEKLESRIMGLVVGLWGWGFLLSPALSGALAEPLKQYDGVEWLQQSSFAGVLEAFPFLLPNMVAAIFCVVAGVLLALFVPETVPKEQLSSFQWSELTNQLLSWLPRRRHRYQQFKARDSGIFTPDDDLDEEEERVIQPPSSMWSILQRPHTRACLAVYWYYQFVAITLDETFPLFCMSRQAGFGLSELEIGKILSLCGLIFAVAQYGIMEIVYSRFGLLGSIRVGTLCSAPTMFLLPFSVLMNRDAGMGTVRWSTFFFLACVMACYRIFSLVFFSNISVMINRTVPTTERATVNGLSVLGMSIAQALGPIFAGFLVSQSVSWFGRAASVLIFGSIGLLAMIDVVWTFRTVREQPVQVEEDSMTRELELSERETR